MNPNPLRPARKNNRIQAYFSSVQYKYLTPYRFVIDLFYIILTRLVLGVLKINNSPLD